MNPLAAIKSSFKMNSIHHHRATFVATKHSEGTGERRKMSSAFESILIACPLLIPVRGHHIVQKA